MSLWSVCTTEDPPRWWVSHGDLRFNVAPALVTHNPSGCRRLLDTARRKYPDLRFVARTWKKGAIVKSDTHCEHCAHPNEECTCTHSRVGEHNGGPFDMRHSTPEPGRISRDEMLMRVAMLVALRGTCNRLQVGAVIAIDGRIISTGYVGAPAGMPHCSPETCNVSSPCTRTMHAEANAIAWAARKGLPTEGATLYATHSPCHDVCAKLIINAGIKRVVYGTEYRKTEGIELLRSVGIVVEHWIAPGQ